MKLLAWIDRVDECSQRGEPRPLFQDESGECIFPPEGHPDEKWWLTEMSLRKQEEQRARAEDIEEGPASDATDEEDVRDEKDINKLTDDEESDQDVGDSMVSGGDRPVLPVHVPRCSSLASWRASSSSQLDNSQQD